MKNEILQRSYDLRTG